MNVWGCLCEQFRWILRWFALNSCFLLIVKVIPMNINFRVHLNRKIAEYRVRKETILCKWRSIEYVFFIKKKKRKEKQTKIIMKKKPNCTLRVYCYSMFLKFQEKSNSRLRIEFELKSNFTAWKICVHRMSFLSVHSSSPGPFRYLYKMNL